MAAKESLEYLLLRSDRYHAFVFEAGLDGFVEAILGRKLVERIAPKKEAEPAQLARDGRSKAQGSLPR